MTTYITVRYCLVGLFFAAIIGTSTAFANTIQTASPDSEADSPSGSFFDLTATQNVKVTAIEAFADAEQSGTTDYSFDIWYRTGSYVGNETSSAGWTMLGPFTGTNLNDGMPVVLTLTTPFSIAAGQTFGFAVSSTQGGFQWTDESGATFSDANLTVSIPSVDNGFDSMPIFAGTVEDHQFAGAVDYQTAGGSTTVPDSGATLSLLVMSLFALVVFPRLNLRLPVR